MSLTDKIKDCILHHETGENNCKSCYFPIDTCPYKGHIEAYETIRLNYHKEQIPVFFCLYEEMKKKDGKKE
jgi:hypothetical protein